MDEEKELDKQQETEETDKTDKKSEEKTVEKEKIRLRTKTIPAVIMLLAASVVSIFTYIYKYPLKESLIIILITMIVFLIFGEVIKAVLDKFELPDPESVDDEGEVIKKKVEESSEADEDSSVKEK